MKKTFPFILLLLILMLSQQFKGYSQDTSKSLPDGTNGFYFTARTADTVFAINKEDLAPNEFVGTSAMFRVGAGYIGDFTAYALSDILNNRWIPQTLIYLPAIRQGIFVCCSVAVF